MDRENKKRLVCNNPWCKAPFYYDIDKAIEKDGKSVFPKECSKCKSFNSQTSGGITWEDREYEDEPKGGGQEEIRYTETNKYSK
jgi:hypothetical protein